MTTPVAGERGLTLEKTSGGVNDTDGNGASVGDTITYFFVVTNTGTTTLAYIAVDDLGLGRPISCGSGVLTPGASRPCQPATYTLTEADLGTTVENNSDIWLIDSARTTRFTSDPSTEFFPMWSPDGTRLAFSSNRDGDWDIYVMNADGSRVRQLVDSPGLDDKPQWSPDGSRISGAGASW